METKTEEIDNLEPISLPISNHLVKSPTSFSVANFIALCLGATNYKFVKHVTIELLLGISQILFALELPNMAQL